MKFTIIALLLGAAAIPILGQNRQQPIATRGTIDSPGSYVLIRDLTINSASDSAIRITASGVTLDMNGYQISGPGVNAGVGITIGGAGGVKVTNGSFAGLGMGVVVMNSNNVSLSGLQIRGQDVAVMAPPPEVGIMIVHSKAVTVENNVISNVGLGVFVRGGRSGGNRIVNNTITAGMNGLLAVCYNPAPDDDNGPRGDLIDDNLMSGFGTGLSFSSGSLNNVVKNNTIFYRTSAFESESATNQDRMNPKVQLP
jgi:hypothetical protein